MKRLVFSSVIAVSVLAAAAAAQTQLSFKRIEGTTISKTVSKSHQVLTIAGMDIETGADSQMTTRSVAGKAADDGSVRVDTKTESLVVKLNIQGMKVDFDSAKPESAKSDVPQLQPMVDAWKALAGSTMAVIYDREDRLKSVEGAQKIIDAAGAEAGAELKKQLSVEHLRKEHEQARGKLPDKAVKKGDMWSRTETMDIGGGQTLTFEIYYEYDGTIEKDGRTLDRIKSIPSTVKYSLDPNAAIPLKVLASDLKVESAAGILLFDRALGEFIESTSTMRITGPMTFEVNGMAIPGKVALTIESDTRVTKP